MSTIDKNGLKVNSTLFDFINKEVIPKTGVKSDDFWNNFEKAVHELAPINKKLIERREIIQKKIDEWHKLNKSKDFIKQDYIVFLKSIGYIAEDKGDFKIDTTNVDKEISLIAGPQLVVPVDNARYALNAANARWGSLYDALYGTDVISGDKGKGYNEERGKQVITYVKNFLDEIFPLNNASWNEVTKIKIQGENLTLLATNKENYLKDKKKFIGFN